MEARSRNIGFTFPGFPKATRSLRGRADHSMRKSLGKDVPKDSCFFELLATVAGQLLQEQDEDLAARSLVHLESPKGYIDGLHDNSTIVGGLSPRAPKRSVSAIRTKEEDTIHVVNDFKGANHVPDTCQEPLAGKFCLQDNSATSSGLQQTLMPPVEPLKPHSSRKRKMEVASSCQGSLTASTIVENVRVGPTERKAPGSDHCNSKIKGCYSQEMQPARLMDLQETVSFSQQDCSTRQRCNGPFQEMDLLSPFPDMDSPNLVSSGSSEETLFPLEFKSYSTIAVESDRQENLREEISSWKVGDDDENSSESTVQKTLLTKSSSMSYTRMPKPRRYVNSTPRRRALGGGGSKRRHLEVEEQGWNEKARSGKKKLNKSHLPDDGIEQSENFPLPVSVGSKPEDKFKGQPLLSERDKISSVLSSPSSTKQDESHVKLSIKSFMVPELCVVLPESATVANLKKAVMDAAMNLLSGGLCVRVLLQGKKVADETESLLQAGISGNGKSDCLGFMLEPNPFPASAGVDDTFLVLSQNANQSSSRYSVLSKGSEMNTGSYHVGASEGLLEIDANSSGTEMQSTTVSPNKDNGLVNDLNGGVVPSQCALVLHSSQTNISPDELAVVRFGQNSAAVAINKRRIRRPFSVAEVEVLVQAVEMLGTGRWRDVKLQAFPQAKHRTYVDLKDKWKTLVHTASIAPHQRRGEPVPQGLLDRVIQAHSYWTAQQAKQQSTETKVF